MTVQPIETTLQPEELLLQLRALRERIPDFVQLSRTEVRALARTSGVSPRMIDAAISSIGESDALKNALGRSAEELRQDVDFTARWSSVADELGAMFRGVNSALVVRRHRIGLTALQAYQISQQLVRQKEHAHLLPHIAAMRQRNLFGRKRAKPPQPEQPPGQPSEPPVEPKVK